RGRWCLTPLDADVDGAGASVAIARQTVGWRRDSPTAAADRRPCPRRRLRLGVRADSAYGGQWYFEVVVDVPTVPTGDADVDAASAGRRRRLDFGSEPPTDTDSGFGPGRTADRPPSAWPARLKDYGCRLRPGDVVRSRSGPDSAPGSCSLWISAAETFFRPACARNGRQSSLELRVDDPAQRCATCPAARGARPAWRPLTNAPIIRAPRLAPKSSRRNWPGPGAWP
uniref:B30.2/SPRY domain-containing protein n=1 Tax=Macrostomum lignano TaxID=282301 RepID=A0A1I8FE06_9PLAT